MTLCGIFGVVAVDPVASWDGGCDGGGSISVMSMVSQYQPIAMKLDGLAFKRLVLPQVE